MSMKPCPYCNKALPEESLFCPYCMQKFNDETDLAKGTTKHKKPKWMVPGILSAILFVVVATAIITKVSLDHPSSPFTKSSGTAQGTSSQALELSSSDLPTSSGQNDVQGGATSRVDTQSLTTDVTLDTNGNTTQETSGQTDNITPVQNTTTGAGIKITTRATMASAAINISPEQFMKRWNAAVDKCEVNGIGDLYPYEISKYKVAAENATSATITFNAFDSSYNGYDNEGSNDLLDIKVSITYKKDASSLHMECAYGGWFHAFSEIGLLAQKSLSQYYVDSYILGVFNEYETQYGEVYNTKDKFSFSVKSDGYQCSVTIKLEEYTDFGGRTSEGYRCIMDLKKL